MAALRGSSWEILTSLRAKASMPSSSLRRCSSQESLLLMASMWLAIPRFYATMEKRYKRRRYNASRPVSVELMEKPSCNSSVLILKVSLFPKSG